MNIENSVPLWIVASLGKKVRLANSFEIYPAGWEGTLISIQGGVAGWQSLHVTVALDPNDISNEQNFDLESIKPVPGEMGVFDFDRAVLHF